MVFTKLIILTNSGGVSFANLCPEVMREVRVLEVEAAKNIPRSFQHLLQWFYWSILSTPFPLQGESNPPAGISRQFMRK